MSTPPPPRQFDDPHGSLAVRVGAAFAIQLPVAATAGYLWEVEVPPGAPIALTASDLQAAGSTGGPKAGPAPGATAGQVLTFAAHAPGTVALQLRCVRPWESPGQPIEERTLQVRIT